MTQQLKLFDSLNLTQDGRYTQRRPKLFDRLSFPFQEGPDERSQFIRRAPCGCAGYYFYRMVIDGPLQGHTIGDAMYKLCEIHSKEQKNDTTTEVD